MLQDTFERFLENKKIKVEQILMNKIGHLSKEEIKQRCRKFVDPHDPLCREQYFFDDKLLLEVNLLSRNNPPEMRFEFKEYS